MDFLDATNELAFDHEGTFLTFSQEVPDDHLAELRHARVDSVRKACGDFHRVASVPVAVYDLWFRMGHDPFKWTPQELLRRLNADGLDAFITTNKVI